MGARDAFSTLHGNCKIAPRRRRLGANRAWERYEHVVGEGELSYLAGPFRSVSAGITSSSAEDGSPRKSAPILSTSSSKNSGFEVLALRIDWMILPGIEPI